MRVEEEFGLKPCPFCGGHRLYIEDMGLKPASEDHGGRPFIDISCDECKASICGFGVEDTAEKWNRRSRARAVHGKQGNSGRGVEHEGGGRMSIMYGIEYIGYLDSWTDEERLTDEEIVRCRDCKHARHYELYSYSTIEKWYCEWHSNPEGASEIEPDGFCAWGKRR